MRPASEAKDMQKTGMDRNTRGTCQTRETHYTGN